MAHQLAARLGYRYLNTGAMYRAVAWACLRDSVSLEDETAVTNVAREVRFTMSADPVAPVLLVNDQELGAELRTPDVSAAASQVAAVAGVRALLVERQRSIAAGGDWVAEGRDQGTAVFPDSPCKIYLDADPAVRAERRAGDGTAETAESIAVRDARDAGRATDPLRPADDAVTVDTTGLTIDQVVERVAALVTEVVDRSKHQE